MSSLDSDVVFSLQGTIVSASSYTSIQEVYETGQDALSSSGQETGRTQEKFNHCEAEELRWLSPAAVGLTDLRVRKWKMTIHL